MEQVSDSSIFQAILLIKEHNKNNDEDNYREMVYRMVETWEKAAKSYRYKLRTYTTEEANRNYANLMKGRPTTHEYNIYRERNRRNIKPIQVIEAENLLIRVKTEIKEVLKGVI
ncbi:hypothetical protein N9O88_00735 [bacterium]|nr:hypothetical protein [bacterium]